MPHLRFPADIAPLSERTTEASGAKMTYYDLDVYINHSHVQFPVQATIKERLSNFKSTGMPVLRLGLSQMLPQCDSNVDNESVAVCKVAYGKNRVQLLKKEADIYHTKLAALQGNGVPSLYGCWIGQTDKGLTAVLILQDCGEPLSRALNTYPLDFRRRVIDTLLAIHKAGVKHCDVREKNIVFRQDKDGEYWPTFVDFGDAEDHECQYKGDMIPINCKTPEWERFGCNELHELCHDSRVWTPSHILWYREYIPVEWAKDPEELVRKAGRPEGISYEDAIDYAVDEILSLMEQLEDQSKWDNITMHIDL